MDQIPKDQIPKDWCLGTPRPWTTDINESRNLEIPVCKLQDKFISMFHGLETAGAMYYSKLSVSNNMLLTGKKTQRVTIRLWLRNLSYTPEWLKSVGNWQLHETIYMSYMSPVGNMSILKRHLKSRVYYYTFPMQFLAVLCDFPHRAVQLKQFCLQNTEIKNTWLQIFLDWIN